MCPLGGDSRAPGPQAQVDGDFEGLVCCVRGIGIVFGIRTSLVVLAVLFAFGALDTFDISDTF